MELIVFLKCKLIKGVEKVLLNLFLIEMPALICQKSEVKMSEAKKLTFGSNYSLFSSCQDGGVGGGTSSEWRPGEIHVSGIVRRTCPTRHEGQYGE